MAGHTSSEQTPQQQRGVSPQLAARLACGEITLAEFAGLSREQQYQIAAIGYSMMNSGKLEEARAIYRGLVAASPYDSVFHCHLAAAHLRTGEVDEALAHFDLALRYNIANVDALVGRGETFLNRGQFVEALKDLRAALELDTQARRPSTMRARAMLLALKEAAAQKRGDGASQRKPAAASLHPNQ